MYIVQVFIRVKKNDIDLFISASQENAVESLLEDGIVKFDVLQNIEDPQNFLLTEVYSNEEAPLEHKKTLHYKKWKETVAEMMDKPRQSLKYRFIDPNKAVD